jgi:hypothetical protein
MTTINPYAPPNPQPEDDPPLVAQLAELGEGMTVEFEQAIDDMVTFHVHYFNKRMPVRRHLLGILALVPLAFAVFLVLNVNQAGAPHQVDYMANLMLGLGIFFAVMWLYSQLARRHLIQRNLNKLLGPGRNLNLTGPRRITITPEFVISASPLTQSASRWLGIEKIETDGQNIYIFNSTMTAFIIPRRAFSSDVHYAEYLAQANEYLARHLRGAQPLAPSKK